MTKKELKSYVKYCLTKETKDTVYGSAETIFTDLWERGFTLGEIEVVGQAVKDLAAANQLPNLTASRGFDKWSNFKLKTAVGNTLPATRKCKYVLPSGEVCGEATETYKYICNGHAIEQEVKEYGRYCEHCKADTFNEKHLNDCPVNDKANN